MCKYAGILQLTRAVVKELHLFSTLDIRAGEPLLVGTSRLATAIAPLGTKGLAGRLSRRRELGGDPLASCPTTLFT